MRRFPSFFAVYWLYILLIQACDELPQANWTGADHVKESEAPTTPYLFLFHGVSDPVLLPKSQDLPLPDPKMTLVKVQMCLALPHNRSPTTPPASHLGRSHICALATAGQVLACSRPETWAL